MLPINLMQIKVFTSAALAILTLIFTLQANAQKANKLAINGVSICGTTIAALQQQNSDLKEVELEEMDLAKGCYGQDSRYVAGKGYASEKYPGLIFQKSQSSDYVSKIRITDKFTGLLPDGKSVDMSKFLLKDMIAMYPQLKNKWGSRGCSDYWNFSNDTISFFVKIDKSKQPQFPVDEAYYLNKPIVGIDIVLSCYNNEGNTDFDVAVVPTDPLMFIDSVKVSKKDLMKYNPDDISVVTVYKDKNAMERGGLEAKNGLIYIETKTFARKRYRTYFSRKSEEYAKLVPAAGQDLNIQYILNKRVLKDNFEGDLALVDDSRFQSLQIISKEQLTKSYGVTDKDYGVVIIAKPPANLKSGSKY
jgi:hypothetical protein